MTENVIKLTILGLRGGLHTLTDLLQEATHTRSRCHLFFLCFNYIRNQISILNGFFKYLMYTIFNMMIINLKNRLLIEMFKH